MGSEKEGDSEHSHVEVMRDEITELKDNVARIKNITGADQNSPDAKYSFQDLTEAVIKLNNSVDHLVDIFRKAGQVMEEQDRFVEEKLNALIEQNKEIANGVIAVAKLVKSQGVGKEAENIEVPSGHMRNYDPYYHLSYERSRNLEPEPKRQNPQQAPQQRQPQNPPQREQVPEQPAPPRQPAPQSQAPQGGPQLPPPVRQNQGPQGGQSEHPAQQGDSHQPPQPPQSHPDSQKRDLPPPPDEKEVPEPPEDEKGFFSRFKK